MIFTFVYAKLWRLLQCVPKPNLQGEDGDLQHFCPLQAPTGKAVIPSCLGSGFMANQAEISPQPCWPYPVSQLECLGTLLAQVPPFLLWPWGSWDHNVAPRILSHFTTWVPFRQRHVSLEQISKGSNFASRAIPLSGSWLTEAPSPHHLSSNISLQIHFSTPPALQKLFTFLLVELQWFFSSSSDWIHVCSEWFNR